MGDHSRTLVSLEDALKDWVPPPKEEEAPSVEEEGQDDGPGFSLAQAREHLEKKHGKKLAVSTAASVAASIAPSRNASRPATPGGAREGPWQNTADALGKAAAALFALGRERPKDDEDEVEEDALLGYSNKGSVFHKLKHWEQLCSAAIEATRLTDGAPPRPFPPLLLLFSGLTSCAAGYCMFRNWDCQACKDQLLRLRIKRHCTDMDLIKRRSRCRKCQRLIVWHQSFVALPEVGSLQRPSCFPRKTAETLEVYVAFLSFVFL